jgi:5-methyltetrahydropteroyltriglutamate--homocysteine methyltransferase
VTEPKGLWTTQVGSLPKPPEILKARADFAKGRISREDLRALERKATEDWVRFQDEIGMDVIVDGEQYRGDMVAFFAEELEGFTRGGLVRSYGNRYYRKPIVTGELRRTHPITLEWWEFAQSLTDKPVKGMLTGPYTIRDWSFDEHYDSREDAVMALAEVIREEAEDLKAAGAKFIQIDEPAVSTRMDELELAIKALGVVTAGLDSVHTITHICYGDFHNAYPRMLDLPVDQIDLEMTNSNFDLLEEFREYPFTKSIGLGVADSHSHVIETPDQVADGIRRSLEVIPAERTFVDPDCGLKTRTVEEAREKLRAIVEGTRKVREEVGLA